MKEFLAKGTAWAGARHCARVPVSLLGLEHDSDSGQGGRRGRRRHGKGQLGSGGLAGRFNFTPHDWEADRGFKTEQ